MTPEHVGLATLVTVVLVFGVHSFIDWTWYVPGTVVVALLAAGWVAGRGPARDGEPAMGGPAIAAGVRAGVRTAWRPAVAALVVVLGVLAAWTAWQPLRATQAENDALAAVGKDYDEAAALAQQARDRNPLSIDPLVTQALVEISAGHLTAARHALVEAVRLQPSNPASWEYLASFAFAQQHNPRLAIRLLGPTLHLDPQSTAAARYYLNAYRELQAQAQQRAARKAERQARRKASSRP